MDRNEFEHIRDLHGKRIDVDIRFEQNTSISAVQTFKNVPIWNEPGHPLFINGLYNPKHKTVVYNIRVDGLGPICRVCVNGVEHGNAGRTHKHSFVTEECARTDNLGSDVVVRNDLEGKTAREVFRDFCARAHIKHAGTFYDPQDM